MIIIFFFSILFIYDLLIDENEEHDVSKEKKCLHQQHKKAANGTKEEERSATAHDGRICPQDFFDFPEHSDYNHQLIPFQVCPWQRTGLKRHPLLGSFSSSSL